MKQRKKRPVPPPPPMVMDEDNLPKHGGDEEDAPPMMEPMSSMYDCNEPEYLRRHALAQELQLQVSEDGFVLLKNTGALPMQQQGLKLNVFGRHAKDFLDVSVCEKYGVVLNQPLLNYYNSYRTKDAAYTGSGFDEITGEYVPQCRTTTGMFGGMGYIDPEPFIGYDVCNEDGSVRVRQLPSELLEEAEAFSDTAVVVIYRHGGEGADHEKGDERLSEGEAATLSYCTGHFQHVLVVLATNSVIDGDFLAEDTVQRFYQYTYGGGVYSNNIGHEILADYDSRVELRYRDAQGNPQPHVYPIQARRLSAIYTCNKPGDCGAEALLRLIIGKTSPSGRLTDEIVYDYDDNPVSRCSGGLVFSRQSTGEDLYIYGHNYVAYKEGVYLGYKYFETFCPERVVYPYGYGLSYTSFDWKADTLQTAKNSYGELRFSANVTVTNIGSCIGKDVVELYVTAPYDSESNYHLEKPRVMLAAFAKTKELEPGISETVTLTWNARDIACYSDTAECYVLEAGTYQFAVATNANTAHTAPSCVLSWELFEDMLFMTDEVTGTPYRNLFTGSEAKGWRYDAHGTEKENIVYLHRIDIDGVPTVAPGTYPEYPVLNEITRETAQILDLETRGISSYYEMDATDVHIYSSDIPAPTTNAVYRDAAGNQKNFMLQDVYRYTMNTKSPEYHNLDALKAQTGMNAAQWDDQLVWDYFLDQFSVNEMLCRFYHCGFDIPALPEYGIPVTYSADTPGQIGANNKIKMKRTTVYCDTILACTFDTDLCYRFGLALAEEAAASGIDGTSYFYAPGSNLHRSCLSGKNNNYFSEDAYLSGQSCGYFLKGLQEGGINGCLKHFACNDQELSREGLVVFANEQTLRENYFAAFEHAIKIAGGQGIMTSLGRVGTVNACGNTHLTVELLRKEWGFDGMVITDGYGVTSYMYEINDMIGASSGLLCFGNSGNFGECRDFMELYRYYLQYPGRTTAALRLFMQGCMHSLLRSHTFLDLFTDYDYYTSEDAGLTTDINWFDAQVGLGYEYAQGDTLKYLGIKLQPGESNPPSMMPNDNCKDRGGTIVMDDYGLVACRLLAHSGETLRVPLSVQKSYGMSVMGFAISFDTAALELVAVEREGSILSADYEITSCATKTGANLVLGTKRNVFARPCGKLCDLIFRVKQEAMPGSYTLGLMPMVEEGGSFADSILDKQGNPMSFSLTVKTEKTEVSGGWSGVYQSVDTGEWWNHEDAVAGDDEMADVTLLSGSIVVI